MPQPLFLIDAVTFGVVALLIFLASVIIFTIPVFATRGTQQVLWALAAGFVLTVEAGLLIALGILVDQGKI